jgi:hypothetical protein
MKLTTQEIHDALAQHKTLRSWAATLGMGPEDLRPKIAAWRRTVTAQEAEGLGICLRDADVGAHTVEAVVGWVPSKNGWPPPPSHADLAADARHIAKYGYV